MHKWIMIVFGNDGNQSQGFRCSNFSAPGWKRFPVQLQLPSVDWDELDLCANMHQRPESYLVFDPVVLGNQMI